jgi:signal transduction histidine kinase
VRVQLKKFKDLIGPYPYNPYFIFIFMLALFFSRFIPVVTDLPRGSERTQAAGLIFLISIIPGAIFSIIATLLKKFRFWSSKSLGFYILEISCAQLILIPYLSAIHRILENRFGYSYKTVLFASPGLFIGAMILALFALALMNRSQKDIEEELDEAEALNKKLEADRAALINSDEEIRRQVSQFLHDRVQSELMVSSMKLQEALAESTSELEQAVPQVLARLETIRGVDLKLLTNILTPNFAGLNLKEAIDNIVRQYAIKTKFTIAVSESVYSLNENLTLALYRIVEQALLNVVTHGPADNVSVIIDKFADSKIAVEISDDGPGSSDSHRGVGTSIIDSWVGILGGTKEIITSPGNGYQLKVQFRIK